MAESVNVTQLIDGRRIGGFQYLVAALCAITVFIDGFDVQSISLTAPSIAQELHLTRAQLGPLFTASLFGLFFGQLGFGPLADKIGRRWVIILCTALFGVFTLVATTATTLDELLLWRFVAGLGMGGAMPNGIALTAEFAPERRRATVVMIMFTGYSLGAAAGGAVAAWLIPSYGWRAVWYVGGLVPLALLPLLVLALPESIRFLVISNADGSRIARLIRRITHDVTPAPGTRYVVDEMQARGVPVAHLFRDGRAIGTVLLWTMFFMNLCANYLVQNWIPVLAHDSGIDLRTAVIIGTMFQVGGTIGSLLIGWPMDKYGPYNVIPLLFAGACLCTALIGFAVGAAPALLALTFGAGLFIVGGQNAANALAAIFYPTAMRATGVGWCLGIGRIGAIVGPLTAAALLSAHVSFEVLFLIGAVTPVCAVAAALAMGRRYRA